MIRFRPIEHWPENWKRGSIGKPTPFRASYESTVKLLEYEIGFLKARDSFVQIDLAPEHWRMDGSPRKDREADYRGVILTIDSETHGVLTYPCDRFEAPYRNQGPHWQANLRAVALGLSALRQIERYGIAERGQQYAGFAQIGSGIPMGTGQHKMTVQEAERILMEGANMAEPPGALMGSPEKIDFAYRTAARAHHPDRGGNSEVFMKITAAKDRLVQLGPKR